MKEVFLPNILAAYDHISAQLRRKQRLLFFAALVTIVGLLGVAVVRAARP